MASCKSASSFLASPCKSLTVTRATEVRLDPGGREYGDCAHLVEVGSLGDLRALGLVPEELDEKPAREAVARDDDEAHMLVWEQLRRGGTGSVLSCCCRTSAEPAEHAMARGFSMRPIALRLRAATNAVRKRFHPNLARILSDVLGRTVKLDDPVAVHTHRWIWHLDRVRKLSLWAFLFEDITVEHDATLNVLPPTSLLRANKVQIYSGGHIVSSVSYLHLKCSTIQGSIP